MQIRLKVLIAWFSLLVCFTGSAHALVFQRDILTLIYRQQEQAEQSAEPGAAQVLSEDEAKGDTPATERREKVSFYTEMRGAQALQLDWVKTLNRIGPERTVTIVFSSPTYDRIEPRPMRGPIDVVSIDAEGTIVQIIPDLVLAEMDAAIETAVPVKARLLLTGGAAAILQMRPGDRIAHPYFKPAPKVMTR